MFLNHGYLIGADCVRKLNVGPKLGNAAKQFCQQILYAFCTFLYCFVLFCTFQVLSHKCYITFPILLLLLK